MPLPPSPRSAAVSPLATDTITFLFTDIEGSTRLWEEQPDAMRVSLARHDALVQRSIVDAGGIVFKTLGDAFCAAFANAPDALVAAASAQLSLCQEPWPEAAPLRVRMALHTGAAEERNNDYYGPPLNRVSRLLSAGHGGQTLVSAASYELVRDHLPNGVGLLDLGLHRLKDLERPEHVFQVTHPDLPDISSPLRSLDNPALPNNLPRQLTSFIGREQAIADVTERLQKTGLLTLTGSGGSGKTRLSLQVAADVLETYPDGAWLAELAPLAPHSEPALLARTVAQALGIEEQAGQTLTQTLTEQLKTRHLLLLLDNCEHMIAACASFTATLLRACPQIRVLATSREPLGIAGEALYRVPSLSLPDPKLTRSATPASLSPFESVRLFIERAQAVRADFAVTNQNAPTLAQLCFQLDGIPLALELAAARVRSLTVEQINDKLDTRFRLLTGGDRSALPRQQTLRALVDWSYDLLSGTEKVVFARLSLFAGGWLLEAAENVCGVAPVKDWEVLDILTSLVDKSLVLSEEAGSTVRYRMQETLRQYAAEKRDVSDDKEELQTRYRDYFVALAEEAESMLRGPDQGEWLSRLESEHDNLRAVLDACARLGEPSDEDAEAGLRLVGALFRFWYVRGFFSEGREQTTRALERGQTPAAKSQLPRAKALIGAGNLAHAHGDYAAARTLYNESLVLYQALNHTQGRADALACLGNVAYRQGDSAAAQPLYEESLATYRALGHKQGIANLLMNLGNVAMDRHDYATAQQLLTECLVLLREVGHRYGIADALLNSGNVAYWRGDYASARSLYEESLALYQALGHKQGVAGALNHLGDVAREQGDFATARRLLTESLVPLGELGHRHGIAYCLEDLAAVCLEENAVHKAVVLLGAANALRESLSAPLSQDRQAAQDRQIERARSSLSVQASADAGDAVSAAWARGHALSLEEAIDYALDEDDR